jgi:transglutaminase-like putative cysteine protease
MERGDSFEDAMVSDPVQREVSVHEDRDGAWCVEYFDEDGHSYVTVFVGPRAETRARDYFDALRTGRLRTIRDASVH